MLRIKARSCVAGLCFSSLMTIQSVSCSCALIRSLSCTQTGARRAEVSGFIPSPAADLRRGNGGLAISTPRRPLLAKSSKFVRIGLSRSIGEGFPRSTLMSSKNVPQFTEDWEHGHAVGGYSDYIDVRAPCEFEEDHIPGAINLPVLNDEQRIEVGTLYKANPFEARRLGAAYVGKNVAGILEQHFADKGKDYRPLVYCWRGGQRSGSLSQVLSQIGYRTSILKGGYKTYRTDVMAFLKTEPAQFTFNVVSGPTGSCKTRLLHRMHARGLQVLDLEELARHRGSVLGEMGAQPSQKAFESLMAERLRQFSPELPVWVEAESNNIGKRCMPQGVMEAMQRGVRYQIEMPLHQRVKGLLEDYHHLGVDTDTLRKMMTKLARFHSKAQVAEWSEMIDRNDGAAFVESLLVNHYDPTYRRSHNRLSSKHEPPRIYIPARGVDPEELDEAIEACLSAVPPPPLVPDVEHPEVMCHPSPAAERKRESSGSDTLARV